MCQAKIKFVLPYKQELYSVLRTPNKTNILFRARNGECIFFFFFTECEVKELQ